MRHIVDGGDLHMDLEAGVAPKRDYTVIDLYNYVQSMVFDDDEKIPVKRLKMGTNEPLISKVASFRFVNE